MASKSAGATVRKLSDLVPDARNANAGTKRGAEAISKSLKDYGAGRSILIDRKGRIIAGNKTVENAKAAGLEDVQVVQTDGKRLIAVQRTDLDLEKDVAAKELAIADNRTGELDLAWSGTALSEIGQDVDLGKFFSDEELLALTSDAPRLKEIDKELRPKSYVRVLLSVPVERAAEAKQFIDQLSGIPEIEIDYSAN